NLLRWYSRPTSISLPRDPPSGAAPSLASGGRAGLAGGRQVYRNPRFQGAMTRILDRYLLREVLGASFAVTLLLMLILMCYRFARVLGEAAAGALPRDAVLTRLGLTSVYYLLILAPFGLFLGVMLALGRLYRDSEMTAISACGIGPVPLLRALPLLAWLARDIAPWAAEQALLTKRLAQRDAEIGILEPGRFKSADDGNIVFYAERVSENGTLENVFIQRRIGDVVHVAGAARGEQRRHGT